MDSLWWYPGLFGAALVAGFVDSIAGGGGLITIPVLLSAGLPPAEALGTNKLQASFGSGSAMAHFAGAGLVDWRQVREGMLLTAAAAMLGALTVQLASPVLLRRLIPALLIGIALYFLLCPRTGERSRPNRLHPRLFAALFGVVIGFYDGFLGPGTGSFWAIACVSLLGLDLLRATAYTKAMNFASNVGALALFIMGGQVWWGAGLVMGAGQWTGARLGSRLAIARGARFIRPVFLAVCMALALKLLLGW